MATIRVGDQQSQALTRANEIRLLHAALRDDIRHHRVRIIDVISDPPLWAGDLILFDLIRYLSKRRNAKTFIAVGRDAANKQINLVQRLDSLPQRTIDWVREQDQPGGCIYKYWNRNNRYKR